MMHVAKYIRHSVTFWKVVLFLWFLVPFLVVARVFYDISWVMIGIVLTVITSAVIWFIGVCFLIDYIQEIENIE